MIYLRILMVLAIGLLASLSVAQSSGSEGSPTPAWIARSNQNAKLLLEVVARYSPEAASDFGLEGYDDQVVDYRPNFQTRFKQSANDVISQLEARRGVESDPLVKQDLEILIKAGNDLVRETELDEKYKLPYFNVGELVFSGLRTLLDERVTPERRKLALIRLKRYAGADPGYTAVTQLAEDRTRERLNQPGLMGPIKAQIEKDLSNSDFFIDGIGKLFQQFQIAGYEEPFNKLKQEVTAYNEFVRKEILPRSRDDFRLPPELYAFRLEQIGVDISARELVAMAHAAFDDIQKQMQELAPAVAKQHGYTVTDYRDVIHALKQDQWTGPAILPNYKDRIAQIEEIIRREHLVTLPQRPMRIRLASEAESASVPSPYMSPPRLIGNTGEPGEFVLPLTIPAAPGAKAGATQRFDDFTFAAASWTLIAHEGRPGHELQFDSMVEHGVSQARAIFAFNSTNVEGWGLYSEAILLPYMPPDGQLISLQLRLMRAARAFLDPELQMGKVTPEQAHKILTGDVGLSEAMANSEVERYTFRSPAQATSYFYGYTRLMQLRKDTEKALGPRFNQQKFHDFILSQGLLPPALLRKAVVDDFIPQSQVPAVKAN